MARPQITLHCDPDVRDILCRAIRDYAFAAYPEGGSDCAQVARYTLLELAATIEAGIGPDSRSVQVSRRPRAMVQAALTWYFDRLDAEGGAGTVRQRELFAGVMRESPVSSADLAQARADDAARRPVT